MEKKTLSNLIELVKRLPEKAVEEAIQSVTYLKEKYEKEEELKNYESKNGLSGLNRDILIKLFNLLLLKDKTDAVRMLVGMCQQYYVWKKHRYVLGVNSVSHILKEYPVKYVLEKHAGDILVRGSVCVITPVGWNTAFLDTPPLLKDIFRWVVRIKYGSNNDCRLQMGVKLVEELFIRRSGYGAPWGIAGSCCLEFSPTEAFLYGIKDSYPGGSKHGPWEKLPLIPDEAVVSAEVDFRQRTLRFFVNGKLVTFAVSNIHSSLRLGMAGEGPISFTTLSFQSLTSATSSLSSCIYVECNEGYFGWGL